MQVFLDHSEPETDNITTFYFKSKKPLHYTAGQYIELTVPHTHADDRGDRRWFTLSSSPTDEFLAITTRFYDKDSSSFKKALFKLPEGSELYMSEPMGDFVLPKLIQTPLVFVCGGIGITPFHSIAQWLVTTEEDRPIKLLYGVNSEDDIIFQETFEKAGIHNTIVVSNPSDAWGGERGHVNAELILGLEKPSDDTLIYLSGPEPMVEALEADLKTHGVSKSQIVTDSFPNYTAI